MSKLSRRNLAGAATAGLLVPAGAFADDVRRQAAADAWSRMLGMIDAAAKPSAIDLRLLELQEIVLQASTDEERAAEEAGDRLCSDDPAVIAEGERWEAARNAAYNRGKAALEEMANLRADSLLGISIKALQAVEATIHGASEGQIRVALSLWGDIVRACPQLDTPRVRSAAA